MMQHLTDTDRDDMDQELVGHALLIYSMCDLGDITFQARAGAPASTYAAVADFLQAANNVRLAAGS